MSTEELIYKQNPWVPLTTSSALAKISPQLIYMVVWGYHIKAKGKEQAQDLAAKEVY